jgi:hypothetical protein
VSADNIINWDAHKFMRELDECMKEIRKHVMQGEDFSLDRYHDITFGYLTKTGGGANTGLGGASRITGRMSLHV